MTCSQPKIAGFRCREMKSDSCDAKLWRARSPLFHSDQTSAEFLDLTGQKIAGGHLATGMSH